jgi:hypothetical protein
MSSTNTVPYCSYVPGSGVGRKTFFRIPVGISIHAKILQCWIWIQIANADSDLRELRIYVDPES